MIRKCGACAMRINGLPRLACSVFLRDCKGSVVTLEPLSKFPLVKDSVVDRSVIFEALKRTKLWLERCVPASAIRTASGIDLLRLLCGCCLEVCPNFDPNSEFVEPFKFVNAYRILNEEQDIAHRTEPANAYRQLYFEGCGKFMRQTSAQPESRSKNDTVPMPQRSGSDKKGYAVYSRIPFYA